MQPAIKIVIFSKEADQYQKTLSIYFFIKIDNVTVIKTGIFPQSIFVLYVPENAEMYMGEWMNKKKEVIK